jgi:hypothetical protein
MYATELINDERYLDAVKVFEQYGASANPENFNIYKRLIDNVCRLFLTKNRFFSY